MLIVGIALILFFILRFELPYRLKVVRDLAKLSSNLTTYSSHEYLFNQRP